MATYVQQRLFGSGDKTTGSWSTMANSVCDHRCGAISAGIALVSSSGTARQLENEADALYVGGGAMFLEMFLATLSLLTAVVVLHKQRLCGYVVWSLREECSILPRPE